MKALISLSGGMDSATAVAVALSQGRSVELVHFHYGTHAETIERKAACNIAEHYKLLLRFIDLRPFFGSFKSALLPGGTVPDGKDLSSTVVPSRNLIFASILSGMAWSIGAKEIWLGIHAGDHDIYPDCRPEFLSSLQSTVLLATDGNVEVVGPFIHMTKADILRKGFDLSVPYHLTRSCYKGLEPACGKCSSCTDRLKSFAEVGEKDPIAYAV